MRRKVEEKSLGALKFLGFSASDRSSLPARCFDDIMQCVRKV